MSSSSLLLESRILHRHLSLLSVLLCGLQLTDQVRLIRLNLYWRRSNLRLVGLRKCSTSWLQHFGTSRSSRRSGTNRLGHGLSLVMTRTSHHENPHDIDTDDDKDELSSIVSLLVAHKYCTSPTVRANIQKATVVSMPVPRKILRSALVDLHHDETTTKDKWLTLGAIGKLIYTRFDFDAGIDFTVRELKKAANEVGPLGSKISQENHTIVKSRMMEFRRKDFVNAAKKNIECEPVNCRVSIGRKHFSTSRP
jgi:hypothetical protein